MKRTRFTTTGRNCMAFQRGDVVLVPFPFSDLSTTKIRPAVVVSSALYHDQEPDLILAAIGFLIHLWITPFMLRLHPAGVACPELVEGLSTNGFFPQGQVLFPFALSLSKGDH
jgi:hypothetical protein